MTHGRPILAVLIALLATSCNAKTADEASLQITNNPTPPVKQDAPPVAYDKEEKAVAETPTPSSVLYFIYQKDGDGASSYEVENGSWATYWYGYRFELDGKQYFTGFAYQTQDKYGKSEEENYPDPDAKATITQATYTLTHPGTDRPWTFQGNQYFVGEFGGYEKGNEVDETRKPQTYQTADGKLLLAVPTWYLATGVQVNAFDLLLFNPHELLKTSDKRWDYLGNIVIGTDNSAACDDVKEVKQACAKSYGALSFVPQEGSSLPLLKVQRTGTGTASAGRVRTLGPGDAYEYRYDPEKKQYQ